VTTRRPGFLAAASLSSNQVGQVNPGARRFWRVLAVSTQVGGTGANDNFAVAEIAMRAFIGGTNIANGQTYASSSTVGVGFEAAEAFDSNVTTFLDTTDATDGWVSVDFGVGNDAEVHEIAFTNIPNATRKCPAELRVQYSDDGILWINAFIIIPDPWTDTQETRIFTAGYAQAQYATTDFATMYADLSCVGAWGTLLRNHGYTGPALRVEDNANPGTTTDVFFDANGLLTGALPYGSDSRVVILYDQFGSTDLFATTADNISLVQNDGDYSTWRLDFNPNGELTSTVLTGTSPAWEISNPVWAAGFKRTTGTQLRTIWGVAAGSGFMEMGLWQEDADLHWRVNGGNPSDWLGTDWNDDFLLVQADETERAIGDMSTGVSPAQAWYKGNNAGTRQYTAPIAFTAGQPLNIGGGLPVGLDWNGFFTELAIFDPVIPLSLADKDALDAALKQADFFITGQEIVAQEQRAHIILGAARTDSIAARSSNNYAVFGAPRLDSVAAKGSSAFAILGAPPPSQIAAREQRLHVIIVP